MNAKQRYEKKNADKIRERKRLWYLENKQSIKEKQDEYYQAHPEKLKKRMEQSRDWKRRIRKKCVDGQERTV